MLNRIFHLQENGTRATTEVVAGVTTFLTMAYIIFVQPAILSGRFFSPEIPTGMDYNAVMVATCLSAALATLLMGLLANYPIGQAPAMGHNVLFVVTLLPAAKGLIDAQVASGELIAGEVEPWQVALGVIFIAGCLFLLLSLLGVREKLLEAVSSSMRNGIAVGIGLFIAFIGLQQSGLIVGSPGTLVALSTRLTSPDMLIFFFGLFLTAGLMARGVRGSIILGILASLLLSYLLHGWLGSLSSDHAWAAWGADSKLMTQFTVANQVMTARPPSMEPTFLKFDLLLALSWRMVPFILLFLFMDVFDTMGTLLGVTQQAGLIQNDRLPRARRAMLSDAVGTVAGAAMGTSTVTSYIESASGVEQGGRTGLTAVVCGLLFLAALFFSPLIAMVGSYAVLTAPALVLVGAIMMGNVRFIEWDDKSESIPAFLTILGILLTYSIADGMALGFISYPIVKLLSGRSRDIPWLCWVLAIVLLFYLLFLRAQLGA